MAQKEELEQQDKPLSLREQLTITILLLLIKVIKPFSWANEDDNTIKELKELIKKGV